MEQKTLSIFDAQNIIKTKLKPYINHKYQIWINLNQQKLNYLCHLSLCFSSN